MGKGRVRRAFLSVLTCVRFKKASQKIQKNVSHENEEVQVVPDVVSDSTKKEEVVGGDLSPTEKLMETNKMLKEALKDLSSTSPTDLLCHPDEGSPRTASEIGGGGDNANVPIENKEPNDVRLFTLKKVLGFMEVAREYEKALQEMSIEVEKLNPRKNVVQKNDYKKVSEGREQSDDTEETDHEKDNNESESEEEDSRNESRTSSEDEDESYNISSETESLSGKISNGVTVLEKSKDIDNYKEENNEKVEPDTQAKDNNENENSVDIANSS